PERFPKALDLPEGLRVLRAALDVFDPFTPELFFEFRRATPCRVLPALVRQNLSWCSVVFDSSAKSIHHELALLVMCDRVRNDEARVIIHEALEVQTLVTSQQKREDVRLPKLIGLGTLETTFGVLALLLHRRRGDQSSLVQDAPHLGLRHPDSLEARE